MDGNWLVFTLLATMACTSGHNFGSPLFLTSYIESGNIAEGRHLARVPFTDDLQIESYAGFVNVNKDYNSNLFFWYFPAIVPSNQTTPVLLWLQGGPGASSLFALFTEIGPIQMHSGTFHRRQYNWALDHHLIFIDSPVGTGFSFTDSPQGYCTNQTQIGEDIYSALVQFFQLFPELQQNKLFVTGESYAGKYGPTVAYTVHKKNPTATLKINLGGISIGNALFDPENQMLHSEYLHQIGLVDYNQAQKLKNHEQNIVEAIREKDWNKASTIAYRTFGNDTDQPQSIFTEMTGFKFYYNLMHTTHYINFSDPLNEMLEKNYVRQGIHVGNLTFSEGVKVMSDMRLDYMKSVAPWLLELIDNYHVMIYSGQLDVIVPFTMTENSLRKLKFRANEEYKKAKRHIWRVDGEIAGYVKRAQNLVEIMVRKVGHMVPADHPKWGLELITKFAYGRWYELR